jgi:uncharacterized membrane protein
MITDREPTRAELAKAVKWQRLYIVLSFVFAITYAVIGFAEVIRSHSEMRTFGYIQLGLAAAWFVASVISFRRYKKLA